MAGRKHLKLKESDITRLYSHYQIINKLEALYPCEDELYSLINDNNFIEQVGPNEFEIINNGLEILIQNHSDLINKCRYKMNFRTKIHHFLNNLKEQKTESLSAHEIEVLDLRDRIQSLSKDEYFKFYKLSAILMSHSNNQLKNRQFENQKKTYPKKELTEKQIANKELNHLKFLIGGTFVSIHKRLYPNNEKSISIHFSQSMQIYLLLQMKGNIIDELLKEFKQIQQLAIIEEIQQLLDKLKH